MRILLPSLRRAEPDHSVWAVKLWSSKIEPEAPSGKTCPP